MNSKRKGKSGWLSANKINLILLSCSILITCIIGLLLVVCYEIIVNPINGHDVNSQFHEKYGWAPVKNKFVNDYFHKESLKNHKLTSNEMGFRGAPVDKSKKHIIMAGDSVVWGYGVSDDETSSHYLEQILSTTENKLQVLNLGVSGYGIDQYYLYLKDNLKHTNPAYIVVIICTGNDFENTVNNNSYGKSKSLFVLSGNDIINIYPQISHYSCFNLTSRSKILNSLKSVQRIKSSICGGRTLGNNESMAVIAKLLSKIDLLAREYNSKPLFVLSPMVEDYFNDYKTFALFETILNGLNLPYINLYDYLNEIVVTSPFQYIYIDAFHYTPKGNELVASAISSYLRHNLR